MVKFLTRRLLSGVTLAALVTTLVFFLARAFGVDPAEALLGTFATEEQLDHKRAELGLDRPLVVQYADWVGDVLTGDLGTSWSTSQPVAATVGAALPITLSLAIGALLVSIVLGLVLGMIAAVRRGWLDNALQVLVIVGFALPGFWLALVLAGVFAVQLRWLPATGYIPFAQSPLGWASTVTLPIAALSIGMVAGIAQQARNAFIDINRRDFVRTLRSRGVASQRILFQHVLRNAAASILTIASLQFVGAFGGAVIVEKVFALRGIGTITQSASSMGDIPLLMGIVLVTVAVVVLVNLAIDLLLGLLIPKARAA